MYGYVRASVAVVEIKVMIMIESNVLPPPNSQQPNHQTPKPHNHSKALRPSYLGIDVMYWCFVKPLEMLGIFWDVKIGA